MSTAVQLRHELHAHPELSSQESATAARLQAFFEPLQPDRVTAGLGGTGVAFEFGTDGPAILLRAELDALPIREANKFAHRSQSDGVSHKCGHDGHMAILARVGEQLAQKRPRRGRVILLFQPAEETGAGARAVLEDKRFAALKPDFVFGLHNVPGEPLGSVIVRSGTFTCASRGMSIMLEGTPAHAAQPETGNSPALAMAQLLTGLHGVAAGVEARDDAGLTFVTVVGATLGDADFGVAPGHAAVHATLRSANDAAMAELVEKSEALARGTAEAHGLGVTIAYTDVFDTTVNAPAAVAIVQRACAPLKLREAEEPFRWSEDFGCFTQRYPGAFFGLGAGSGPALHNDDYDFPDSLVEIGAGMFLRIAETCLDETLT